MTNLTRITKPTKESQIKREWHLFDAKGKILGRLISKITQYLIGKHKTNYVPYLDMGDYVVVINAEKVKLTGKKEKTKIYTRYSGYPGGLKILTFEELKKKNPVLIIRHAVSGMLPKNKLRKKRLARLFVFAGEDHPYKDKFKLKENLKEN